MRARSLKREREYRQRRQLVAEMLEEHPSCPMVHPSICIGRTTEVHEILSRARGGSILDKTNCISLCSKCHQWITEHPKEATEMGYLRSQYQP